LEVITVTKNHHPGKRDALKEYKRLYIAQLHLQIPYDEFYEFEKAILADDSLGIVQKTLHRAQNEALLERKKQLQHSSP
jgi:hypothetical protein